MTATTTPAADAAKVQTVKAPEKKVKIKLLRDAIVNGSTLRAGAIVETDEKTAAELCDRGLPGYHPFYGTMPEIGPLMGDSPNPLERKKIFRAMRVA
jgi:hypothetical protein